MADYLSFIKSTVTLLENHNLIDILQPLTVFSDEPFGYYYGASLLSKGPPYSLGERYQVNGDGFSFFSSQVALSKTLGEYLERLSQLYFDTSSLLPSQATSFPLDFYTKLPASLFEWYTGEDVIEHKKCLVPAQLLFLTSKKKSEPLLTTQISTGAAGGTSREEAILNGIYEVLERDTVMSIYLNKISVPQLLNQSKKSKKVDTILERLQNSRLELKSFRVLNDMSIPIYLSILYDPTGIGPAITVGSKAQLHEETALIGSIEEAVINHIWTRRLLLQQKKSLFDDHNEITTREQRALFWAREENQQSLDFLGSKNHTTHYPHSDELLPPQDQLKEVLKRLADKKFSVFSANITHPILKSLTYYVYKVVIPNLQPLYLDERKREINSTRLKQVCNLHLSPFSEINAIPHPFV